MILGGRPCQIAQSRPLKNEVILPWGLKDIVFSYMIMWMVLFTTFQVPST